jgi:uncharacterized protein YjgD (DUF1641 family)
MTNKLSADDKAKIMADLDTILQNRSDLVSLITPLEDFASHFIESQENLQLVKPKIELLSKYMASALVKAVPDASDREDVLVIFIFGLAAKLTRKLVHEIDASLEDAL